MPIMEINSIPIPVTAVLGKKILSKSDYLELQIGDIIVLDQPIQERVEIRFGEQSRFLGTLGLFNSHKAVVLDECIYPGRA